MDYNDPEDTTTTTTPPTSTIATAATAATKKCTTDLEIARSLDPKMVYVATDFDSVTENDGFVQFESRYTDPLKYIVDPPMVMMLIRQQLMRKTEGGKDEYSRIQVLYKCFDGTVLRADIEKLDVPSTLTGQEEAKN